MSCGVSSCLLQNVVFTVRLNVEASHVLRVDSPFRFPVVDHNASKIAQYFAIEVTFATEANVKRFIFLELVCVGGDVL